MKITLRTKSSTRLNLSHAMLFLGIPCLIIAGFFALTSVRAAEDSLTEIDRASTALNTHLGASRFVTESTHESRFLSAYPDEENRSSRDFPAEGTLRADGGTFQASWQGEEVLLVWETNQEVSADQFEIQRSANSNDFVEIGNLSAAKGTQKWHLSNFIDSTASQQGGRLYYRLKQHARNGEHAFSQTIELVQAPEPEGLNLTVYPNPANSTVNMRIQGTEEQRAHIQIIDVEGRVVYDELGNANRSLRLPIDSWAAGAYRVTLATEGEDLSLPLNIIH